MLMNLNKRFYFIGICLILYILSTLDKVSSFATKHASIKGFRFFHLSLQIKTFRAQLRGIFGEKERYD